MSKVHVDQTLNNVSETFDTHYCCSMIHADLMLVVVEVLIVLDLEPPRPLPGILLLTGFAEHTAHGVRNHPAHMWSLGPLSAQCVGDQVRVSTELRPQCSDPARPVRPPVMLERRAPAHHISDAVNVIIIFSHLSKLDTLK